MDFFQYITLDKAQNLILDHLNNGMVGSEKVFLEDALGRIVAEDVVAKESLPPFSRSVVDGFALRSADTFGASETAPSLFLVVNEVVMGKETEMELLPGQAAMIPTGGMLPQGADAVVMLEYTERPGSHTLLVSKMVPPGENVVVRGEDICAGKMIVEQGQKLEPQHIGVLAACGCNRVLVRKKVAVAVISTGDELVDIDRQPEIAQLRDINSYALGAMLSEAGCEIKRMGIVKDSYGDFYETLFQAVSISQLVVISGGSSVGARDYTVKAIDALGTPGILFHGIAVKPGKPTIFGMIGTVPVFGLPGHPVAAMTVCQLLVKLAVRKLLGQKQLTGFFNFSACLTRNVASAPGRDDYVNVKLERQQEKYFATPIFGKSGLISILAQADGIMHIPADKSGLYAGDWVDVLLINRENGERR